MSERCEAAEEARRAAEQGGRRSVSVLERRLADAQASKP